MTRVIKDLRKMQQKKRKSCERKMRTSQPQLFNVSKNRLEIQELL